MRTLLRIAYLQISRKDKFFKENTLPGQYELKVLEQFQDWQESLKGFRPQVVLYPSDSRTFLQEVLDFLGEDRKEVLAVLPLQDTTFQAVLPVLRSLMPGNQEKANEERMEASPEPYAEVYQHSLDGILVSCPDGRILAANPAACRILEMTEEEICRAGRSGLIDPGDSRLDAALSRRAHTGREHTELTFVKKSGIKFPVELTSSVFKDKEGEERTVIIFRDVSVKKGNSTELDSSLEHYEDLFFEGPFPYVIYDQETLEILEVNSIAEELYGYTREEFLKLNILDIRPTEEIPRITRHLEKVRAEDAVSTHPGHIHLKKDGTRIHVDLYAFGLTYGQRPCRMAAVIDVADHEKGGRSAATIPRLAASQEIFRTFIEKLSTSEARYKGIVQSQTNYLIRTDLQGNYTYCNEKFLRDFGWMYREQEVLGQSSLSSIMEYHHQAVLDLVERCIMAPGETFQIELDKPHEQQGIRTTLWDFVCLQDAKGNPSEIQCVGIDISARIQVQKQLKQNELRYKLITEATSDCIWDWDIQTGRMMWFNRFTEMFGYDPEECGSFQQWKNLIHPEDVERITHELQNTLEGSSSKWSLEYRFKHKTGGYAYVLDSGSLLRDQDNSPYRAVGSLQDITESKKLKRLLENATKLSEIGSFELDLLHDELYWSPMTRKIHQVTEDFVPDIESAFQFYKEGEYRDRMHAVFVEAIEMHQPFDEESVICTARGQEIWIRIIGQPEVVEGKCIGVTGSIQNIDKIKRTEYKVLNAAREKEVLLDSIGDAFFAVDQDWKITYWNRHATLLLNLPKSEVLDRDFREVFSDGLGSPFHFNYQAAMEDRRKRRFEAFYKRTSAWYEVAVYPSSGGLSVFFRDVTQRKNADARLKELNRSLKARSRDLVTANKGLEQFSYIVSHNLRSPVANILGLSDLLQNGEYPEGIRDKFFSEIFSNVERLDTVITDLNAILKTKAGTKAEKEEVDFLKLVHEVESGIQHILKEEKAEIRCDFQEVPVMKTVKSYLHSIFYNLIVNSIKYRKPDVPPLIEIWSRRKGAFIILSFKDNGLGMDLKNREEQVFHLYKRFHHHIEGKGMGLFMVKTQVEMIGGKITLDSEVNKGTTFRVLFKAQGTSKEKENESVSSLYNSR